MPGLVSSHGGRSPAPVLFDRRALTRYSTDLKTVCRPTDGQTDPFWRIAEVHDLSTEGMGLVITLPLEPGTLLSVELPNQEGSRQVQARVVHAKPGPRGLWLTGCIFLQELSHEELQQSL